MRTGCGSGRSPDAESAHIPAGNVNERYSSALPPPSGITCVKMHMCFRFIFIFFNFRSEIQIVSWGPSSFFFAVIVVVCVMNVDNEPV